MKALTSFITAVFCTLLLTAQVDCEPYVPTEVGSKWELTNYNAKGKKTGSAKYELVDKVENGNEIVFKIKVATYDKKGKETFETTYDAKCIDGVFEFDMSVFLKGDSMKSFQNMDIEVDASKFELPDLDADAGSTLADGSLKVTMASTGGLGINMTILVTDRKVEKREDKTTPAGTYDCIVLSQNISTKMMIKVRASSKEWYAQDIGLVRSESYNKKGKLMGYTELTSIDN